MFLLSNPLKTLKPLDKGARIAIISPSRWIEEARLQKGAQFLEKLGFDVFIHPQNYLRHHLHAGSPEQRAQAIHDVFCDSSVDGVICARGGHGSSAILNLIDWQLIAQYPKIFYGFSDLTPILLALYQKCGFVSFHGPVIWGLGNDPSELTVEYFLKAVSLKPYEWQVDCGDDDASKPYVLNPGQATGRLTGGNLSLISLNMGTSYQMNAQNHILMIEDLDEPLYALDRYLHQLRHSGQLDSIKGLIVGEMDNISDSNPGYGYRWDDLVRNICANLHIPIVMNVPCGHTKDMMTMPIGGQLELCAARHTIKISTNYK